MSSSSSPTSLLSTIYHTIFSHTIDATDATTISKTPEAFIKSHQIITPAMPPKELILLAVVSILPYLLLQYYVIPQWISRPFFSTYRNLLLQRQNAADGNKKDSVRKIDRTCVLWNNFILSSIHAIYAFAIAFYSIFLSGDFEDSSLATASLLGSRLVMISMGYFLADFIIGFKEGILEVEAIVHHLVVLCSELFLVVYWRFHLIGLASMLTEFTTPLINNRWLMDKAGMKESPLYIINGLAIWFGWVFCRLTFSFWVVYYLWNHHVDFFFNIPLFCTGFILLQVFLLSGLNFFWFYKITKGVLKALFGKRVPPQKKIE